MTASPSFRKALASLPPSYLPSYLSASGWRHLQPWRGTGNVWVSPDGKTEVIVPNSNQFVDYAERVAELVSVLAQLEGRSTYEVVRSLKEVPFDLARVKAEGDGVDEGSLPLAGGVALVQRAQQMLLSAACSSQASRSNFIRTPKRAQELMERARLGQTEQGSYVVTILVPMPLPGSTGPEQVEMFTSSQPKPEPFERQVTRRLVDSVAALATAVQGAEEKRDLEPFSTAITRGVSANLCEAVVGAYEAVHTDLISVGVNWASLGSPRADGKVEAPAVAVLQTKPNTIIVLKEACDFLRQQTEPEPDIEVIGHVVGLKRETTDIEGEVTVFGNAGNRERHVTVMLPLEGYNRMVAAHKTDAPVSVTGTLEKRGQRFFLVAPRDAKQIESLQEGCPRN